MCQSVNKVMSMFRNVCTSYVAFKLAFAGDGEPHVSLDGDETSLHPHTVTQGIPFKCLILYIVSAIRSERISILNV